MDTAFEKDFTPIPRDLKSASSVSRPSLTYWQDAWRRLKQNKVAMASFAVILLVVLLGAVGPVLVPNYTQQDLLRTFQAPDQKFVFGTDELGRDLLARLLRGTRVSLTIGLAVSAINLVIGVLYGGIAGYIGGKADMIMMRIIDVAISVPEMIVLILLLTVLKSGISTLILALCLTGWTGMARLVRGQVLQIKENEYVLASRVLGASEIRIILSHLIPNALGPILVQFTMGIPNIIFAEAFLSYIGLGISIPDASWGNLAQAGASQFPNYLWLFFIPAVLFSVTMLAFNLLGDGLRDALDPKMRR